MKEKFLAHFNLEQSDLDYLWGLFVDFGMTKGDGENRTKGNHYFLQGICQYLSVEYKTWGNKLSPNIKEIIKTKYPQLMVQNKNFEI